MLGFFSAAIVAALSVRAAAGPADARPLHLWVLPSQSSASNQLDPHDLHLVDGVFQSVHAAVAAAAAHSPPPVIHLLSGDHRLEHTLELDRRHSGISLIGHGTAILTSGLVVGAQPGQNISSWVTAAPAGCAGCGSHIWKAAIPVGLQSRQMCPLRSISLGVFPLLLHAFETVTY